MPFSIIRSALLFESAATIVSIFPMLFDTEATLACLVKEPTQITGTAKSLFQIFGGMLVLAGTPLLLSSAEQDPVNEVRARRRLTYQILGITEVTLATITFTQ
jgi:hypothetical protein